MSNHVVAVLVMLLANATAKPAQHSYSPPHGVVPDTALRRAIDSLEATSPPGDALDRLARYLPTHLLRHALATCRSRFGSLMS